MGFFEKIKNGLSKTKSALGGTLDNVLSAFGVISDDLYEELEEALIMADIGVETALKIIDRVKQNVKEKKIKDPAAVRFKLFFQIRSPQKLCILAGLARNTLYIQSIILLGH